jgi:hypothetical protein
MYLNLLITLVGMLDDDDFVREAAPCWWWSAARLRLAAGTLQQRQCRDC